MTTTSTLALILAVFVLGVTPGPAVFATIARALASGFRPAAALHVGVVIGDIVLLLLTIFGLATAAQAMGDMFVVVKVLGGLYLIWLGWRMWTAVPTDRAAAAASGAANHALATAPAARRNMVTGLMITLGNPKAILFYAAFLPTFIDLTQITGRDVAIILAVIVAVLTVTNLSYAALATQARAFLRSRRAMRNLNRTAGTIMIGAGLVVATR